MVFLHSAATVVSSPQREVEGEARWLQSAN